MLGPESPEPAELWPRAEGGLNSARVSDAEGNNLKGSYMDTGKGSYASPLELTGPGKEGD